MAISSSKSKTIYAPASSSYGYTLKAEFTETGTSSANNTSTISCSASLGASKIAYSVKDGGTLAVYWHDNNTNTDTLVKSIIVASCGNGGDATYGTKTASGTITPTHKSDGTLSGYAKAIFTKNKSNSYIPATSNVSTDNTALTSIPRQATANSVANFTDEQNPVLKYTNGAGTSVSTLQAGISLTTSPTNPEIAYRDISKTGNSYTFNLTEAERNLIRNSIPNAKERNLFFYVKTILNGSTYYSYAVGKVNIVNANPSIDTISYSDTNSTTTDLTNDDQVIIQNQSTLQFQMFDVVSLKGATLSSLSVNINGNIQTTTYSGTAITSTTYNYGQVDVAENTTAVLTLTDSRGNYSTYNVPLTIWEYSQPTAIITESREANFYSQSTINVDANYSSLDNLNTILIKFRIKKISDSTWGNWTTISDNVDTTFNADNQYAWDIQVYLEDALGTTNTYTINNALDVGIPMVFYDLKRRSVGINCIPENDVSFEVNGKTIVDTIFEVGSIYRTTKSSDPATIFGGSWTLLESNYLDTGWQSFSWTNSTYINSTQSSYTQNKWRVKDGVLYVHLGAGATSTINTTTETEFARVPMTGNSSINSASTRVWNGAVGGGGAWNGFMVMQNTNYLSLYIKPHTTSAGASSGWASTHFTIPLDAGATITTGTYEKEYVWKRTA